MFHLIYNTAMIACSIPAKVIAETYVNYCVQSDNFYPSYHIWIIHIWWLPRRTVFSFCPIILQPRKHL